ncbi:hypothetical protein [Ferrimonas balearica]|uniref:hypothetical protein n=1 Tax=Ferrimonas balearica TaxID=44012 RepID=UPI001C55ED2D|nr:hypothetical protein [Ferrimonas balearica]MBW3165519.1 hypothetical protein [Ferrimonas balearica]
MRVHKVITCKGCGKRRKPYVGSRNRATKFCRECKGNDFWQSSFGKWFLSAALRQSPDSMPFDEDDIAEIHSLWHQRKKFKGVKYTANKTFTSFWEDGEEEPLLDENGRYESVHSYDLAHLDPVCGEGFQGRLTAKNLMIVPTKINQSLGNKVNHDFGFRVVTDKRFNSEAEVRQWCTNAYALPELVVKLSLVPKRLDKAVSDWDASQWAVAPSMVFASELGRLGGCDKYFSVNGHAQAFRTFLQHGLSEAVAYVQRKGFTELNEPLSEDDF